MANAEPPGGITDMHGNEIGHDGDGAADAGSLLLGTVERGREQAAHGMSAAAERLRSLGDERGGVTGLASKTAAMGMDSAAGYMESHTASDGWSRLMQFTRDHPAIALITATVLGWRIGRMLKL